MLFLFGILFSFTLSYSLTNITTCSTGYTLSTPNELYEVKNNLSRLGGDCLAFSGSNITLDCKGYTLTGDWTLYGDGIIASTDNNIIKNCNINNFSVGIQSGNNILIKNVSINNSREQGIRIWYKENVSISDSTFYNSKSSGIISHASNFTNISNVEIYNSIDDGLSIYLNLNSSFTNIKSLNSIQSGVYASATHYSSFLNIDANYNNENGVEIKDNVNTNNIFTNINTNYNNGTGFMLRGGAEFNVVTNLKSNHNMVFGVWLWAHNNTILNSDLRFNTNYNIHFTGSSNSMDNNISNTYLGDSSTDINFGFNNFFNGNFFDDYNGTSPWCFNGVCDNSAQFVPVSPSSQPYIFPAISFLSLLLLFGVFFFI